MGKATTAAATTIGGGGGGGGSTEMKRKKKKGRPSLLDLQKRENNKSSSVTNLNRRSTRRNPNSNSNSNSPSPDFIDDDDERKEKKVKLVVRLPQSNQQHYQNSSSLNSPSDSDAEGDNHEASGDGINTVDHRSDDVVSDQEEKLVKATTDSRHGLSLGSGPTTPLPDKKLLVFILDRLQKKDTYGVFSEPVDPSELPDYHEIVKHPMDFGTVRKKLNGGLYSNLEELEGDILLICSNAMQYNDSDTIYFRQARTIQDLAKRDFENLRQGGENGEPKVVRRGRPPSKTVKKSVESSPIDRIGPELSSGATLASGDEKSIGSNSYNLRKGPMLNKFRSTDTSLAYRSRNGESYGEWSTDWNDEFPASILKADMKYGKKHFSVDENRRDTYQLFHPSASCSEPYLSWNADGDLKRLTAVGVHVEQHAYARSLARYAANLGPVVWKVACKKLETILPAGVKFGPGWVGEGGGPVQMSTFPSENPKSLDSLAVDHNSSRPVTPSAPGSSSAVMHMHSDEIVEAVKRLNSQNEQAGLGGSGCYSSVNPASTFQAQQKSFLQPRNGVNSACGYELSAQMESSRFSMPKGQSGLQEASRPGQVLGTLPGRVTSSFQPAPSNHIISAENKLLESWATLYSGNSLSQGKNPEFFTEQNVRLSGESWPVSSSQQRNRVSVPPDLNVKVLPPGSPSASLQIGSSQQPDLALQL